MRAKIINGVIDFGNGLTDSELDSNGYKPVRYRESDNTLITESESEIIINYIP